MGRPFDLLQPAQKSSLMAFLCDELLNTSQLEFLDPDDHELDHEDIVDKDNLMIQNGKSGDSDEKKEEADEVTAAIALAASNGPDVHCPRVGLVIRDLESTLDELNEI